MKYCVIKIGGRVIQGELDLVASDVKDLVSEGWKPVLVHGGGGIVDSVMERLGMRPRYLRHPSGFKSRYTGKEELEVYVMVMAGLVSKRLQIALARHGLKTLSLTGLDAEFVVAKRKERVVVINDKGRMQVVDGGYTGKIVSVESGIMRAALDRVDALVVSPVAFSSAAEGGDPALLNVDADQMAYKIAASMKAPLAMVTDVPGVILDGEVLRRLTVGEIPRVAGSVGAGMKRKLEMAGRAVKEGAPLAVIGRRPVGGLLRGDAGTVITP